jgi:hypothetical protein
VIANCAPTSAAALTASLDNDDYEKVHVSNIKTILIAAFQILRFAFGRA